ncbi:MAG: hypothetical protein Q9209_007319 [Squamulea sp. 1 TL-2023]
MTKQNPNKYPPNVPETRFKLVNKLKDQYQSKTQDVYEWLVENVLPKVEPKVKTSKRKKKKEQKQPKDAEQSQKPQTPVQGTVRTGTGS